MDPVDTVITSRPREGVALITLNRPRRFNSVDPATDRAMAQAVAALERDRAVRCIVITGAGDKAFCTGADIPTLLPWMRQNVMDGHDDPQFCGLTHRNITTKPLVAAINGAALGGGMELALACDVRIASRNALLGLPEIRLGVLAGGGGCTRLPRSISPALAAEMILTGEPIDAARALEAGLVSRVVAQDELMNVALDLAEKIASRAPRSVTACTRLLRRTNFDDVADALLEERKLFADLLRTEDSHEGIHAFVDKRPPVWRDC